VLAKISTSASAMACAACIATAATLPTIGPAAEQAEKSAKTAAVKLSALTDIDAFSALGAPFLGTDAFSALTVFQAVLSGDIDALAPSDTSLGYAALSAVPSYLNGQLADIDAFSSLGATSLTDIDAFSALGAPFIGTDAFSALGAPFIGTEAFGAIPTYAQVLSGNIAALAPDTAGNGGIAAFSAIPSYLGLPPNPAPPAPASLALATASTATTPTTGSTPTAGANSLRAAVPAAISALVPPAPQAAPQVAEEITPAATVPDNSGADSQNITRDSKKFTPESFGDSPILIESGAPSGEGMRGCGSFLKKIGLSGGESPSGETRGMG